MSSVFSSFHPDGFALRAGLTLPNRLLQRTGIDTAGPAGPQVLQVAQV